MPRLVKITLRMIHESMFGSLGLLRRIGPRFLMARRCFRRFTFILIATAISGRVSFAQRPELVVQTGHSQVVNAVAFSPDGKRLVTGGFDSAIKFWDVGAGEEIRTLNTPGPVDAISFSPDGKFFVSGGEDGAILLWNAETGEEVRRFSGHGKNVKSVAFRPPDGEFLATGSEDGKIELWQVDTGERVRTISARSGRIECVAFSPDGKLLSGAGFGVVQIWNVTTGEEVHKLEGHNGWVPAVAFSPDGKLLATGGYPGEIKLWNVESGEALRTLTGRFSTVLCLSFSPDGKILASGNWEQTVQLWEVETGKELRTLAGHSGTVQSVAFSPDGKQLASAGDMAMVKLWDAISGQEVRTLAGHSAPVLSLALSADGRRLASGNLDATVKVWDLTSGRQLESFSDHSDTVWSVAFSSDAKMLASASYDKTVVVWDVLSGKKRETLTTHTDWVNSVAFSMDGELVASGSRDKTIKLWDANTGKNLSTTDQPHSVYSIVPSPDKKHWASGGADGRVRLWELSGDEKLLPWKEFEVSSAVHALAFSPDGQLIVCGCDDKTVRVLDVTTGAQRTQLRGHSDSIRAVAISRDGKILASGSLDGTLKLWDMETGGELHTLMGHTGATLSVVFSPDSRIVISGGWDSRIKLWDVSTGKELASLIALDDMDWATVTPEGSFDASAGGMKLMHWVVGDELIDLSQLKDRYYDPGLLAKITGFNKEPPRKVEAFKDVKLYPTVQLEASKSDNTNLTLHLTSRGGGIGRIAVRVNGKEVIADARDSELNPDAKEYIRQLDLLPYWKLIVPGQENTVEVIAYNAEGYLASRAVHYTFTPLPEALRQEPHLWALVIGVSKYERDLLNLRFAAKDAESAAKALALAGERLFPKKVHILLLSTGSNRPDQQPTKQNIVNAFRELQDESKSKDIFILYLAGHGVTSGGQDGDFYFLTSEALTGELTDPAIRERTAVSGDELTQLLIGIPERKQVMILDTCASGRLIEKLTEKRAVESGLVRAWDRMKDRAGLWILAGCAADAVSYESSRYGEGVLTYSLLQGIKLDWQKVLRRDPQSDLPEYLDVSMLFNYAADEVPKLAEGIGGIQRPLIAARGDARSFDIGRITSEDRAGIPLPSKKAVFLRSSFQLEGRPRDPLELTKRLDARLLEASTQRLDSSLVFWDVPSYAGAYRLAGLYEESGSNVTAKVFLSRFVQEGDETVERDLGDPFTVQGETVDVEKLVSSILSGAEQRIPDMEKQEDNGEKDQ